MIIIVIKTSVNAVQDLYLVREALSTIQGIVEWTIDFEDVDRVLRVIAVCDLAIEIHCLLSINGIKCSLLSVFDTKLGGDHPIHPMRS